MKKNRIDELQRKYGTGKYKKKKENTKIQIEEAEYKKRVNLKKNKKNIKTYFKSPFLRLYIPVIFLIVNIIIISFFKTTNVKSFSPKLIINHKEIKTISSVILKKKGEILTNKDEINSAEVYMSLEDIKKIIDPNMLYNEKNNEIVLTGKTNLIQILADKSEISINGIKKPAKDILFKEGIYKYIKLNEIIEPLGYDMIISEEFNILLDKKDSILKTLKLKEDTFLRKKQGIFSKKVMKLNKDDTYIVAEEFPKYIYLRTKGGIYGYIPKKKVQNIVVVRKEEVKEQKKQYNYILNYTNPGDNPDFINKDKQKDNAVISNMFEVLFKEKEGIKVNPLFDLKSESYNKYLNKIQEHEKMDMFAKIYIKKDVSMLLDEFNYRIDLILKINKVLSENNINKIAFDFEETKDPAAISRFLIEVKPVINNSSKKIIACPDKDIFKADILFNVVDYFIDFNR